jgi:hypothetical protein
MFAAVNNIYISGTTQLTANLPKMESSRSPVVTIAKKKTIKVLFVVVIGKAINVNENKGNNKITELRTIFRRESQKGQTQMDNQETPHHCDNKT